MLYAPDMPPDPLQYQIFRAAASVAIGVLAVILFATVPRSLRGRWVDRLYVIFVTAIIGYLASNYMEISSTSVEASLSWAKVIYVFIVFLPILWLDFCYRFAFEGHGLSPFAMALSLAFPIATLVVVFVPSLSGLMWSEIKFFRLGDYLISIRSHGPWFIAYSIYTYLFFLGGAALAIGSFVHYRVFYSRQSAWVLCGIALPFATSLVYVLRPFPGLVKDFTPIGYTAGALLFYVALFHKDLFSLAPVGRAQVIERLVEGVLVLDAEGRIVDANPAAMGMLDLSEESLGKALADVPSLPGSDFLSAVTASGPSDILIGEGSAQRSYHVQPSPFARGKIVALTDQTELHKHIARVETLAMSDELTGLPNRRRFLSEGERDLARARRRGLFIAAAMIDFDDFKAINDNRGHAVGDSVLRAFGAIMAKEARTEDVSGRIGGDEFAVLTISGSGVAGIRSLCERLRARLAVTEIRDESGQLVPATISVGIAVCAAQSLSGLDRLLADADTALYAAKHRGRDGIVVLGEEDGK
jgi:diguanylate cyclase (GGDEF)-like protein